MQGNNEIGSEFWLDGSTVTPQASVNPSTEHRMYALSGRTAIDLIIQDILAKRDIKTAYLPAYSCDSMVTPFLNRGIKITLYDISFDGQLRYHIDDSRQTDILYVNNYFGYDTTLPTDIINHFRKKGSIIIYDRTHSMLKPGDNVPCDYSFASIRKWMGVVCGAVVNGVWQTRPETRNLKPETRNLKPETRNLKPETRNLILKPYPHLGCKLSAMRSKAAFIAGDTSIDKQQFLNDYSEFGHHLTEDYANYAMDDLSYQIYRSADLNAIANKRRANALYLHDHLDMRFISELTPDSVPLIVPVFFESKEERDRVRRHLIEQQIYCPVHWPRNQLVTDNMLVNNIIDTELSLICDQRYGISDMQRIVTETLNSNL